MLEERNLKDVLEQIQGLSFQEATLHVNPSSSGSRSLLQLRPQKPRGDWWSGRLRTHGVALGKHFLRVPALALDNEREG